MTLIAIIAMVTALFIRIASPVTIIFSSLCLLIVTGVLSAEQAISGFSNPALFIIASLFVIVGTIQNAGGITFAFNSFLSPKKSHRHILAKLLLPVTILSAFLNNTSIVLILSSIVRKWAIKNNKAPSKFLIPLSYAAIMGGACTLIGTTTNLVVSGMLRQNNLRPYTMFELSWVAVPCAIVGFLYLILFSNRLLPNRKDPLIKTEEACRDFVLEAVVEAGCPLINLSIKEAKLRHLSGLYLAKIERRKEIIGPVNSDEKLKAHDRLIFIGMVHSIKELQDVPHLKILSDIHCSREMKKWNKVLVEAVVSNSSPVLNRTVKEADFRALYGAIVLAIHRNGERIESKIGDIKIKQGDTLLLDTDEAFVNKYNQSRDFHLISKFDDKQIFDFKKFLISSLTLLAIVTIAAFKPSLLLVLCLAAIPFLFLTRCLSRSLAFKTIDWQILVVIASVFGIGKAVEISGAGQFLAEAITSFSGGFGPIGLLAGLYIVTAVLATLITNVAAAVIIFPIAIFSAQTFGLDPRPFIIATTLAASANFASPISYQCNLIVYGPGGYKFSDFLKIGIPLNLLIGITTVSLIAFFWKLY